MSAKRDQVIGLKAPNRCYVYRSVPIWTTPPMHQPLRPIESSLNRFASSSDGVVCLWVTCFFFYQPPPPYDSSIDSCLPRQRLYAHLSLSPYNSSQPAGLTRHTERRLLILTTAPPLGLYTILVSRILYGVQHTNGRSGGESCTVR